MRSACHRSLVGGARGRAGGADRGGQAVWRSARAARRRAFERSVYAAEEAEQLAVLADHLNRDGYELRHTTDRLFPKIREWQEVLGSPLVIAAMPWVIRRLLGRPLRRR